MLIASRMAQAIDFATGMQFAEAVSRDLSEIHRLLGSMLMDAVTLSPFVLAAAAYSLSYLLLGGGFVGAILIFFGATMLGR